MPDPDLDEIAQRYRRTAAAFTETVAAVPDDRWDAPSPCEGWSAHDVLAHVVDSQGMFRGLVGRELTLDHDVDTEPLAAWRQARDAVQADLEDPGRATATYEGRFGELTFAEGVDRFLCLDLPIHRWDIARAVGLDERIDPADVERIDRIARGFGDAMRGERAFGPALEPPPGADTQTRLLAFLGRRAWD